MTNKMTTIKPSVFVITCRSEDGQHYAQHCSDKYGCLSWCQLLAHADRFLSRADAKRFCTQINAKSSDWHTKASIIEVTNEKIEAAEKRAEELGRLAQEEEEEFNRLFPA